MNASIVKQPPARLDRAELRSRWQQMLEDPLVSAIPFKVELNEKGAIEVTPANPLRRGRVAVEFRARDTGEDGRLLHSLAREVWLVAEDGTLEMFDEHGPIETSSFGIALTPPR